jgi:hypothetical protein
MQEKPVLLNFADSGRLFLCGGQAPAVINGRWAVLRRDTESSHYPKGCASELREDIGHRILQVRSGWVPTSDTFMPD